MMFDDPAGTERMYQEDTWKKLLCLAREYKRMGLVALERGDKSLAIIELDTAREICAKQFPEFEHEIEIVFCFNPDTRGGSLE